MKIGISDIVTAFKSESIGSKVTDYFSFMEVLEEAISSHDWGSDRIPGQAYVELGDKANDFVSSGVGKNTGRKASDYVLVEHRGKVSACLNRKFAAPVTSCAVVVYTMDAYTKDPDVDATEAAKLLAEEVDYVVVAVLASAGPASPLSPYRFVHNLAGGNREAQVWTADEIRAKAVEILEYSNDWSMVADPGA